MENSNVKRLIAIFQNYHDYRPKDAPQYRTKAVRELMKRNNHVFQILYGSSDGSRKSNSNESFNMPSMVRPVKASIDGANGNHKRIKNADADVSKCSAAVQTETLLESSLQRRDSDLLQLFRRIENFLVSQSDRNGHQIYSLDRVSSKMATASHRTSTSLQSSPKRSVANHQKSHSTVNKDESDNAASNRSNVYTRASSTPKLPSVSDNQCMKMSSGNVSSHNSTHSSLGQQSASEFDQIHHSTKSDKSCQEVEKIPSKNDFKDCEKQIGTLRKCICTQCPCRHSVLHVDQATQMSLINFKMHSPPKDSPICQKCQTKPCTCDKVLSAKSSSAGDVCSRCKVNPCICSQMKSDRSSKAANENSNRKVKCLVCGSRTCVCPIVEQTKSSSLKVLYGPIYNSDDFSSSEVFQSSTSSSERKRPPFNMPKVSKKKRDVSCAVCRCPPTEQQLCVFCVCHIDKNAHIPRCDCHAQIPRYLIPGFCKCHRRNLRNFDKCICCVQTEMVDNVCPCCEYYAVRMRAKLIETHLERKNQPTKSEAPPPQSPKKYFLKLEETEISKDSSEIFEQNKQPLEVVTIKIPVKRIGKAKVPYHQLNHGIGVNHGVELKKDVSDVRLSDLLSNESGNRLVNEDIEQLDDILLRYLSNSRESTSLREIRKEENSNNKRREKMTRSDRDSGKSSYRTLQECLESNRPDFFNTAEYRRDVIRRKALEREQKKQHNLNNRLDFPDQVEAPKRIFTTAEIRAQTRKKCKNLTEVTQKKEDRKKRELYQTNKLMAEIFAKRLQLKTLRGVFEDNYLPNYREDTENLAKKYSLSTLHKQSF